MMGFCRSVINVAPDAPFSHKIFERVVMTVSGVPIALIYHACLSRG
jgi:hypothetical protein